MNIDCANPFEVGRMEIRRMHRRADGTMQPEAGEGTEPTVTLRGYAAKFNVMSEDMWGIRETILPGAFDGVLQDDCRALFNHDPNMLLGRTASGTCRITADATGLFYEVDLPDTDYADNLATMVARGDVTQSSFAFVIADLGDMWQEQPDGTWLRSISKIGRLYDVSPVTYPAYPDATVGIRSGLVKQQVEIRAKREAQASAEARARAAAKRHRELVLIGR
jgi:hypothetical protein